MRDGCIAWMDCGMCNAGVEGNYGRFVGPSARCYPNNAQGLEQTRLRDVLELPTPLTAASEELALDPL